MAVLAFFVSLVLGSSTHLGMGPHTRSVSELYLFSNFLLRLLTVSDIRIAPLGLYKSCPDNFDGTIGLLSSDK